MFGIIDFATGENAFFQGNYGAGDFLRVNPDGTFSTHLVTNEGNASTIDFATFPPRRYSGTGLMNFDFSGTGATVFNDRVFMLAEPSLTAAVLQGHAKVTWNGAGEDPHRLHMRFVTNPGEQRHLVITFVPVEEGDVQEQ